ncbi:DUF6255 family natural product biosynthesis protein [Streptomyces sp. NPDC037389]|uniref:DUF6255 family natural product biosynthesis protein n=1 Tax=Streptomyces sp. NPDC037389 TaxID=3155369 RepID=UPI0033EAD5E9
MRPRCAHPAEEWVTDRHAGSATCGRCGVRRFSDYAALRWPGRGQLGSPPLDGRTAWARGTAPRLGAPPRRYKYSPASAAPSG